MAQEGSAMDDLQDLDGIVIRINGFLDHSLPVEIHYSNSSDDCLGVMKINDDIDIKLEGSCTDTSLVLYEFDEYSRVSGIISGKIINEEYDLIWHNYDHSLSYNLYSYGEGAQTDQIRVYHLNEENQFDQAILFSDIKSISVSSEDNINLKWQPYEYAIAPYACTFQDAILGVRDLAVSDRVLSVGKQLFHFAEGVEVINDSGHAYDYFYNYRYPVFEERKFDKYIKTIVENQLNSFQRGLDKERQDDEEFDLDHRLRDRGIGDFFVSLVTEELISGYLTFHSTNNNTTETVSFTYDRSKDRFYELRDFWKKEFNFTYFLKSFLENKKRELLLKEDPYVKRMLKDVPFNHYNLTAKGLVFFTDYNFVYGRRSILISYDEIMSFIDNKSLGNFLNKGS